MALYFYRMEGQQAVGAPASYATQNVAASGYYVQSRYITDPEDYEAALRKIEQIFRERFPGAYNLGMTAFNRLD